MNTLPAEYLRDSLNTIHSVPEVLMDEFLALWEICEAERKEVVTQAGRREHYLYYVLEGCQKAYFLNDGKEHIVAFSCPHAFTCIPESFLTGNVSLYDWQCIEHSRFLRISRTAFFAFIEEHPAFERMLWKQLLGTVNGLVRRYHRLLAFSMEERFRDLMHNSPSLINRVPQKDLASYLRIDPTNFSKLINSLKI